MPPKKDPNQVAAQCCDVELCEAVCLVESASKIAARKLQNAIAGMPDQTVPVARTARSLRAALTLLDSVCTDFKMDMEECEVIEEVA